MPRNMSFSMTTQAVIDRKKTVTRRLGWDFLKPGDELWAVEKGMGLKKGEKVKRLAKIRVVSVEREAVWEMVRWDDGPWDDQCIAECEREGFPELTTREFITMFCAANKCSDERIINRIEFEYVDEATP